MTIQHSDETMTTLVHLCLTDASLLPGYRLIGALAVLVTYRQDDVFLGEVHHASSSLTYSI